jgi:hypothetical protein
LFPAAAALVVFGIVIARAHLQSATIDECESYLFFSRTTNPNHWMAASRNHILNSIVVRVFTSIFGLSHLTLRSGAILGAAIYLAAACRLSLLLSKTWLSLGIFTCLGINPFVLDYLVVGRGYSLALGFLMTAVAIHCEELVSESPQPRLIAVASASLGLAFAANFSFAYILIAIWLVAAYMMPKRLWMPHSIPAAIAIVIFCAPAAWQMPKSELYFGSSNLVEMVRSLIHQSLHALNLLVVNPFLMPLMHRVGQLLPILFAITLAIAALAETRRIYLYLAASLAIAVGAAWLGHALFAIPLPLARTGVFFVPLATLFAALPQAHRIPRAIAAVTLVAGSLYFTGCLRLSYFSEWTYQADNQAAFLAVREVAGDREIVAGWEYWGAFEFYNLCYGSHLKIRRLGDDAHNAIFVLNQTIDRDFIAQHRCEIVYESTLAGIVAANCN